MTIRPTPALRIIVDPPAPQDEKEKKLDQLIDILNATMSWEEDAVFFFLLHTFTPDELDELLDELNRRVHTLESCEGPRN
jgi:hypothetical protein